MERNIALLLYAILQFIAFLLVLVATPLDMFRSQNGQPLQGCLTLWGFKYNCSSLGKDVVISTVWNSCPRRLMLFHAAEAFAIVSIFLYGMAFILGVVMLLCSFNLRYVCLGLNIVGAITLCVVWAAMAMTYLKEDGGPCPAMRTLLNYGVGFTLLIIAWVLDIINIFFLLLPYNVKASSELDNAKGNLNEEAPESST
ncbi:putative Amastin surface glycoprotein [Leishmania utingensis]|uniref:Amastin surface glycoprotein n=1 Tax=Leishmania utingensis TaxID=653362 RepID=A0AAW3AM00_9TRYP